MAIPERGSVFQERFVVEALLGKGGMGVVLRARDKRLRRAVAIKFLTAQDAGNEVNRQRFLREARAAAGMSHPGIIQVFDVGETDDGDAFVVMEFVEGRTLRAVIEAGVMPFPERARVVAQVARALAAAHRQGLVHRDVKPDNVMVRDDGRAVVLDFGIARRTPVDDAASNGATPSQSRDETLTQPGTVLGTPAYFSPEQVSTAAVDARSDQFALGVTAFEAFAGRLPWRHRKPVALLSEILTTDVQPLSVAWKECPAGLDAVLARAVARDPEARYPDLDAFADALEPFTHERASGPAPAPPVAPPPEAAAPTGASPPQVDPDRTTEKRPLLRGPGAWRFVLIPAAAVALLALVLGLKSRGDNPAPLVHVPRSVLACAPLATDAQGDAWLGAAAAVSLCRHAEAALGDGRRVLWPAELLGLSRAPDAALRDAFEGDARARAVHAARARAAVWTDGNVRHDGAEFHVTVVLRGATDGALASASARGDDLAVATRRAVDALVARGALPRTSRRAPAEPAPGAPLEGSDTAQARARVEAHPRDAAAWERLLTVVDDDGRVGVLGASVAWRPDRAFAWRSLGAEGLRGLARTPEERREWSRRAYLLAPERPEVAALYGRLLAATRDGEGARGVAARLRATGEAGELAATSIDVALAASEARFARALDLCLRAIDRAPPAAVDVVRPLLDDALELAVILGREQSVADRLVERALPLDRAEAPFRAAAWCLAASPAVAVGCRARVDALAAQAGASARFGAVWGGARLALDGDVRGAAARWRTAARGGEPLAPGMRAAMTRALDEAGEGELADRVDAAMRPERPRWGGATSGDARAAQRAVARGDRAGAQALAEIVVRAWRVADEVPPAVAALRGLSGR